jgi:Icc-related predicted phosphoesterase
MKICCLGDTHTRWDAVKTKKADVLIHAGDWCTYYVDSQNKFIEWLDEQPQTHKIVIAGNHDKLASEQNGLIREMFKGHCEYLEDSGVEIDGVKFYGSPWTPTFGQWWFMKDRGMPIKRYWDAIPEGTDVLITHGPALGILDMVPYANGDPKESVGCRDLLNRIKAVKPKVHVFGHIHENTGQKKIDGTLFVNCSLCDNYNNLVEKPIYFDMPG